MLFKLHLPVAHRMGLEVNSRSVPGFHLSFENTVDHPGLAVCLCILALSFCFPDVCYGV